MSEPSAKTTTKVSYHVQHDPEAHASYVYLPNHPNTARCVARTVDLGHGLHLDLNSAGDVMGIEWLW